MPITQTEALQVAAITLGAAPGADILEIILADEALTAQTLAEILAGLNENLVGDQTAANIVAAYGETATAGEFLYDLTVEALAVGLNAGTIISFYNDYFSDTANAAAITELGLDNAKLTLDNKTEVAEYHSVTLGLSDVDTTTLATVDATEASVTAANTAIDTAAVDNSVTSIALGTLQTAQTDLSDYLATLNVDLDVDGTDDVEAPDATSANVTTADTAADAAVVTADNAVLDATAALAVANAATFDAYATAENTDDSSASVDNDADGLTENSIDAAVAAVSAVTGTSRMSDANIAAAITEAEADVAADETAFSAEGVEITLATITDATELTAVYTVDSTVAAATSLTAGDEITSSYAGTIQTTTITLSGALVAAETVTFDLNGTTYSATADGSGALTAGDFAIATGYTVEVTSTSVLTITGPGGIDFVVDAFTNTGAQTETIATAADATAMTASEIITAGTLAGYTDGLLGLSGGSFDITAANLGQTVDTSAFSASATAHTATTLQAAITTAEAALTTNVTANGTSTELLADLRAALNAFVAAEGDSTTTVDAGQGDVLTVRDEIAAILDHATNTAAQIEVAAAAEVALLADANFAAVDAEAITATEQAILTNLEEIAARQTLVTAIDDAEAAFVATTTGGILTSFNLMQTELAGLATAITTAETDATTAADTAAATQLVLDAVTDYETAVADATAAITNATDHATAPGLGLNLLTVGTDASASSNDDVYLYVDGTAGTVLNFGTQGTDIMYVGSDYTLVSLAEGEAITDSIGDASVLEAIIADDGSNTTIYFEDAAYSANGSTASDLTAVTLTGVTGLTASIDTDGFLTLA